MKQRPTSGVYLLDEIETDDLLAEFHEHRQRPRDENDRQELEDLLFRDNIRGILDDIS